MLPTMPPAMPPTSRRRTGVGEIGTGTGQAFELGKIERTCQLTWLERRSSRPRPPAAEIAAADRRGLDWTITPIGAASSGEGKHDRRH